MVEIRLFQWLVPLVISLFILNQFLRYRRGRINLGEAVFAVLLWLSVALLAVFPDEISSFIARLFGIKSNTNAVLFLGLGCLFYFQYRLYQLQVKQRRDLTQLSRKIALLKFKEEGK
ncbi:DUF2304 family protein [Lewinella sp. LCG006]|uniref:DUF2304 family protein n=1 Tax=Lewinella sp. LCG006 TaxID=3231911 RepID=UPI00345F670C